MWNERQLNVRINLNGLTSMVQGTSLSWKGTVIAKVNDSIEKVNAQIRCNPRKLTYPVYVAGNLQYPELELRLEVSNSGADTTIDGFWLESPELTKSYR
jgi:hypothetical protein